ncbi:hypothetical protein [Vibrio harveyi]|uniref:hypothetical protein n=1 Tax=Vibrio harveyi TaxID=669 RepID=UPI002480F24A|nr:hypothetical protein [Vibrio harveyi]
MKSFLEYWSTDEKVRTEGELTSAMSLLYQLTNLAFCKSFDKIMLSTIKGSSFVNQTKFEVILAKSYRTMVNRPKYFLDESEKHYADLKTMETELGLTSAPKRSGICREISIEEYELISGFLYALASYYYDRSSHCCWELRDCVRGYLNHLLLRDTLKSGFENPIIQKVACDLLDHQSLQFFDSGFPVDFFVNDRLTCLAREHGYWVCYPDRLSTWNFDIKDERMARNEAKEQNKMLVTY